MKFKQIAKLLILCLSCCILGNSCALFKDNSSAHITPAFEGDKILIIPPISDDTKMSNDIGRSITKNLLQNVSSDIRYGGDISKLKEPLSNSNLMADGQVNMQEVSKIGTLINASEVICIRITSYSAYPPQKVSCLIITRTMQGTKYKQRVSYVNVNMKDIEDQKELAKYSGGELRGPLGDRFIKKTNINAEAAMLSNTQFNEFIGYKISKNILHMKKYK
jgi:hypothetical protein